MTITALQLADRIMKLANEENAGVSQLKLIKLCYLVQAWNLTVNDSPLFNEDIEAWIHGPSIPSVYDKFKVYGSSNIEYTPSDLGTVSDKEQEIIEKVWNAYKVFDAWSLRDMTHTKDSPWHQVYDGKKKTVITTDIIKNSYRKKFNS